MNTIGSEIAYISEAKELLAEALVNTFGVALYDIWTTLLDGTKVKTTEGLTEMTKDGINKGLKRLHDWEVLVANTTVHTTNPLTFSKEGDGEDPESTFDGSTAVTLSHNSIGALPLTAGSSYPLTGDLYLTHEFIDGTKNIFNLSEAFWGYEGDNVNDCNTDCPAHSYKLEYNRAYEFDLVRTDIEGILFGTVKSGNFEEYDKVTYKGNTWYKVTSKNLYIYNTTDKTGDSDWIDYFTLAKEYPILKVESATQFKNGTFGTLHHEGDMTIRNSLRIGGTFSTENHPAYLGGTEINGKLDVFGQINSHKSTCRFGDILCYSIDSCLTANLGDTRVNHLEVVGLLNANNLMYLNNTLHFGPSGGSNLPRIYYDQALNINTGRSFGLTISGKTTLNHSLTVHDRISAYGIGSVSGGDPLIIYSDLKSVSEDLNLIPLGDNVNIVEGNLRTSLDLKPITDYSGKIGNNRKHYSLLFVGEILHGKYASGNPTGVDGDELVLASFDTSTNKWNLNNGVYVPHKWANVSITAAATYNTEPEVKSIKIGNGSTTATATSYCKLEYDATNKCLKFIFV